MRPLLTFKHYRICCDDQKVWDSEFRYIVEWREKPGAKWRPFKTGLNRFMAELAQAYTLDQLSPDDPFSDHDAVL